MTDYQRNRHEMHATVLGVLDTHADAWASVPVMQTYRDQLAAAIAEVRKTAEEQSRGTKPATATKGDLRKKVADRSRRLAQALGAYARRSGLSDLAAEVEKSAREFQALADSDLASYSEVVVGAAREHLPGEGDAPTDKLGAHGVTAAFVDELDALDDDFARDLASPREARVAQKGATAALARLIRETQTFLKREVDPTVAFLAPDQPAFAQAYRDARIIVDRRGPSGGGSEPPPDAPDGDDGRA